jgi:hypothetical protein
MCDLAATVPKRNTGKNPLFSPFSTTSHSHKTIAATAENTRVRVFLRITGGETARIVTAAHEPHGKRIEVV